MKRKPRDKRILCQKVSQQQVTPEKEDGLTGEKKPQVDGREDCRHWSVFDSDVWPAPITEDSSGHWRG